MLDGPVGELRSDNHVYKGRDAEKPGQTLDGGLAIKFMGNKAFLEASFSQVDADRDQHQTCKEYGWKNQENNDPDVGISDVPLDLMRQYEQK